MTEWTAIVSFGIVLAFGLFTVGYWILRSAELVGRLGPIGAVREVHERIARLRNEGRAPVAQSGQ